MELKLKELEKRIEALEKVPKVTTTSTDEPMVVQYPQVDGITPTVVKEEKKPNIEKLKDKLHDKIEIHVCEVEENTLIAQGMLKALGMMDEVLETEEQEKDAYDKVLAYLKANVNDFPDYHEAIEAVLKMKGGE
jgi:hypothetical protein